MAKKEFTNIFLVALILPLVIISCSPVPNKVASINYVPDDNNKSIDSSFRGTDGQNITSMMTIPTNPKNLIASAIDQIRNSTGSGGHNNLNNNTNSSIVRDSTTVLLGMKVIPARDFIPLYDSNPYKIMNGHLTAKLPCDLKSESQLKILVGHVPNLKAVQLEVVKELSKPGDICVYHLDLPQPKSLKLSSTFTSSSELQTNNTTIALMPAITDLAIQNPTDNPIRLPYTTAIVIGINEIMPINHQLSHEYVKNSKLGNSTDTNNFDIGSNTTTSSKLNIFSNNSSNSSTTDPSTATNLTN